MGDDLDRGGSRSDEPPPLATVRRLHLDDVDNYQRRLYFWQNVPRRAKYNEIWNEVKATQ